MSTTLLVFDIDGTLISTGAGRQAFNRAFERFFGLAGAAATVPMAGRTDPAIFGEVCQQHGVDPQTFGVWKLTFLEELAQALLDDPGHMLPGVLPLLEQLRTMPDFTLALGTGNVEEGARMKLACHDLNRFFPTGGFGADGASRDEVIARAIERSRERHGRRFDRVVILGDTPADILCGRANQGLTVGVATGYHSMQELEACGADVVLPDFSDTATVLAHLQPDRHRP